MATFKRNGGSFAPEYAFPTTPSGFNKLDHILVIDQMISNDRDTKGDFAGFIGDAQFGPIDPIVVGLIFQRYIV